MTIQIAGGAVVSTLPIRLELARRAASLTQDQMADAIEMSVGTVRRAEAGTARVKRPLIAAWAMATGCSAKWLETGIAPTVDGEGNPIARPKGFEPLTFCSSERAGQSGLAAVA